MGIHIHWSKYRLIFIGANIDSYSEAGNIGIRKSRIANYDKSSGGVEKLYSSIDVATTSMRKNISLDDVNWKKDLEEFD